MREFSRNLFKVKRTLRQLPCEIFSKKRRSKITTAFFVYVKAINIKCQFVEMKYLRWHHTLRQAQVDYILYIYIPEVISICWQECSITNVREKVVFN